MTPEYPEFISPHDLVEQVLGLHNALMKTDASELNRTIHEYDSYTLRLVELDAISVDLQGWLQNKTVVEYSKLDLSSAPPIVLGTVFTKGKYNLVDGLHRAAARLKCGESTVWAYVPVF